MRPPRLLPWAFALAALLAPVRGQVTGASTTSADGALGMPAGPGPIEPDVFLPAGEPEGEPRRGGRLSVHLRTMPASLNYLTHNRAETRQVLAELHEGLIRRDWESWEFEGVLARTWTVEDTVTFEDEDGSERVVWGRAEEVGDTLRVSPASDPRGHVLGEPLEIPADRVANVERGTVFTFHLRDDAVWHDGHPFDADDVRFSWECTRNPAVECGDRRWEFARMTACDVLDEHTVRFTYSEQYFLSTVAFSALVMLPAHRFDLRDPDNPDHDPEATGERRGSYVNEHPGNLDWIGLGPYRLAERTDQFIEAARFDDYFDPANGGWVDRIRWRLVENDSTALTALLAGEIDFLPAMLASDYFGERTSAPEFEDRFYKGHFYTPYCGYRTWNMAREPFGDVRVRRGLGMCFDWDELIRTFYSGLAVRLTSETPFSSPAYDHSVEPLPFDPDAGSRLLAEAGWYDRDGDGWIDKDGAPLEFEFLMIAGTESSAAFGRRYQEQLKKIGVRLNIASHDYGTCNERLHAREYDLAHFGWAMPPEHDPEQRWHSRWVGQDTSNHPSLADERVDALIEAIQVELDADRRNALFHRLHRRLYELQPYMFGLNVAKKFAVSKRVRNFQIVGMDPGYVLRRWYLVD